MKKMNQFKNTIFMLSACTLLSACAVGKVAENVERDVQIVRKGPSHLPEKSITDFAEGLRCMDNLFITFGYSPGDYIILIEDIKDKTEEVKVGTRDMLISAISDMTRRSQTVHLMAYGSDAGNLISLLSQSKKKDIFQQLPPFDIIGSVTYLDKDIVREQADVSGEIGGTIDGHRLGAGTGISASSAASVLGLDLSIISTQNMTVLPGVTTRNSVAIFKTGSAKDFDAGISKTGTNFSISRNRGDGMAQALRVLIELSAIELVGKLLKVPYWKCLGLDPNHQDIRQEVADWHYQLVRSNTIHPLLKAQLYLRGYYQGEFDNQITDAYNKAIIAYKNRLGLPATPLVDLQFYAEFINSTPDPVDVNDLAYKRKNTLKNPDTVASNSHSIDPSNSIQLKIQGSDTNYAPGEPVSVLIESNTDGYVTCYLQSADQFFQIFPNRFTPNGFLARAGSITLPDSDGYTIVAENDKEILHCFITTQELRTELPGSLLASDFHPLSISNLEEIVDAYDIASKGRYDSVSFEIEVEKNADN